MHQSACVINIRGMNLVMSDTVVAIKNFVQGLGALGTFRVHSIQASRLSAVDAAHQQVGFMRHTGK